VKPVSRHAEGLASVPPGTSSAMRPDLPQGSFWELLGIILIVAIPTIPITYFLWTTLRSGQRESREVASGRASATPFALLSIVGTVVLIVAVLVVLLTIAVRAALT
jgi:hypothetical protein